MEIPGLNALLLRDDLSDVDSALLELYGEPTQIDTAKTLKRLLDAALSVSESEGLRTGFEQPLQDIINEIGHPLESTGIIDRGIKLSPRLPGSIPRLLEGAAKSTLSEQCATALVNYGIDILSILNAAVVGSDTELKKTAQDILKVLGSFNIDVTSLPPVHPSDAT